MKHFYIIIIVIPYNKLLSILTLLSRDRTGEYWLSVVFDGPHYAQSVQQRPWANNPQYGSHTRLELLFCLVIQCLSSIVFYTHVELGVCFEISQQKLHLVNHNLSQP